MNIPVSDVTTTFTYHSELLAAEVGLSLAINASTTDECGGLIWKHNDVFCYSDPVTIGNGYEFAARSGKRPDGAVFVALYHTHPSLDDTGKLFSVNDVKVAKELNVNSYIYSFADKKTRCFIPGKDSTYYYDTGDHFSSGDVSEGHVV